MRWVLTIWLERFLDEGWQSAIGAFDAVSVKIADGRSADFRRADALEIIKTAIDKGIGGHSWGYHYCRTVEEAKVEGFRAGKAARSVGSQVYYLNLEKHWAGIWGSPRTEDPEAAALAFCAAFKDAAPSVSIAWNGFAREKKWRGRRFCTDRVMRRCDLWVPMCYGSIHRRVSRATQWRDRGLDLHHGAMIASGRIGRDGQPTLRQRGRYGLDWFLDTARPDMVAIWYGYGSKGMLTAGNEHNVPWPEYIKGRACAMAQN